MLSVVSVSPLLISTLLDCVGVACVDHIDNEELVLSNWIDFCH